MREKIKDRQPPYYHWLHSTPGIGNGTMKKLLEHFAIPEKVYEASEAELERFFTLPQEEAFRQHKKLWNLEKEWERLQKENIRIHYLGQEEYPKKLQAIPDPPFVFYEAGKQCTYDDYLTVAVVGARECSSYGSLAAKELGRSLAEAGIPVISGMARGVDSISQWAALEAGGCSAAVLGSGIDVCYPKGSRRLYERLLEEGTILTEYPLGTEPRAGNFPRRNRIISALADVVAVVEAGEKSGTLITVDMALEQGKDVYAMPGRITDRLSRGCNHLLKQGAGLILSPEGFIDEILFQHGKNRTLKPRPLEEALPEKEQAVWKLLTTDPQSVEDIFSEARKQCPDLTLGEVMELLLDLCVRKKASQKDGYYVAFSCET